MSAVGWAGRGWLAGKRVLVTRPFAQSPALCERLIALGATPIEFPVITIVPPEPVEPLDAAIAQLSRFDWVIFTSVNGVEQFFDRMAAHTETAPGSTTRWAAIGPATAQALRARGITVSLVPGEYRAEAILAEMGAVAGQRILLPRADIARADLADGLRARGAQVNEVAAYCTLLSRPGPAAFDALAGGVDVITFTSSSTVRGFVTQTAGLSYGVPLIACIGPVTAATARDLGLRVDIVARAYTIEELVQALDAYTL